MIAPAAHSSPFYNSEGDNLTDSGCSPVCLLDHKYQIARYPAFYFIVRKDKFCDDANLERVCLYREGVVNPHLFGHPNPGNALMCNDLRLDGSIQAVYKDMEQKAEVLSAGLSKQ